MFRRNYDAKKFCFSCIAALLDDRLCGRERPIQGRELVPEVSAFGCTNCECMKKEQEAAAAFEKERQQVESVSKSAESGRPKKNDLCFTRKATGEFVCPN